MQCNEITSKVEQYKMHGSNQSPYAGHFISECTLIKHFLDILSFAS